ncbi:MULTISPECIES: FlgO family outer membrane protein [unclassified Agarivorans]|uniref:FlgO family outer membrane protein n=1 Tax=unclassified Agarivorans TaxID=2636026 RepID=UPI0026E18E8D|nr:MULTISPECIES: FlgO family outer membrane protein [unclassified Agarivorans]MDO6684679.1 FlgO family outer membrane protein [Agarivorans sp. 3_MG-2023]MDO6715160.1 FlgO family outer membrane protein [Agarivorans sp. 2_MG-2023]
MRFTTLIILLVTLQGCNTSLHHVSNYPYVEPREQQDAALYVHVDNLSRQLTDNLDLTDSDSVAVSTVVDLDDLQSSDSFGRQVAEAMFAALSREGVNMVEPRLTGRLQMDPGYGEFSLSRDAELLRKEMEITYVVVGSFQRTTSGRHVNMRLVELSSQEVVSAAYQFVPNIAGATSPRVTSVNGSLERHEQSVL